MSDDYKFGSLCVIGIATVLITLILSINYYESKKLELLSNTKNNLQIKTDDQGLWVLVQPITKVEQDNLTYIPE